MRKKILIISLLIPIVLTACGNKEEQEAVSKAKEEFRILYSYEEDRILPVLNEEKTARELAEEYLLLRLGLEGDEPTFKERGVLPEQGVFIESAIRDGGSVPNITAMSRETIERIEQNREDRSLQRRIEDYEELKENRQAVLDQQFEKDNTGRDVIEEEIKRQVAEFKQDREKEIEEEFRDIDIEYEDDTGNNDVGYEDDFEIED